MLGMTGGLWCLSFLFYFLVYASSGKEGLFVLWQGKRKREAAIVSSDLAGPH